MLTIDPPGSRDLDQAMHLERRGRGYRVHYAIADVAAFVVPGGAIDREAHARGLTLYAPDTSTPLHPPVLSADAASLLPDRARPALLWTLDLDADGSLLTTDVRRAIVRSRERYDYETVSGLLASGTAGEGLLLLREVGRLRERHERERGAITLPTPEQEVVAQDGGFALAYRAPLDVESWNAQISLLTGMAAAALMLAGHVGVLRTLPPAPPEAVQRLRRTAAALGVPWPATMSYAELLRALDPADASAAALLHDATSLLRGAGYTAFDGGVPEQAAHAALAAPYAHATAPLRRLVDRYVGEVCLALCAVGQPPEWARAALATLPQEMAEAQRRAAALERECLNLVEAVVLEGAEGQEFDAVVVDADDRGGGVVQLREPAVRGRCGGAPPLGEHVRVRLLEADAQARTVRFALVTAPPTVPTA